MKPHKHAKEIKAWADGAEIEYLTSSATWRTSETPGWYENTEYRIKPQPKPDVVWFMGFSTDEGGVCYMDLRHLMVALWQHQLKITIDGETGKTKSAEVLK